MEQKLRKQRTVHMLRDYVTRRVTIEIRDYGLLIDNISFTKDEFIDLQKLIKDVEL